MIGCKMPESTEPDLRGVCYKVEFSSIERNNLPAGPFQNKYHNTGGPIILSDTALEAGDLSPTRPVLFLDEPSDDTSRPVFLRTTTAERKVFNGGLTTVAMDGRAVTSGGAQPRKQRCRIDDPLEVAVLGAAILVGLGATMVAVSFLYPRIMSAGQTDDVLTVREQEERDKNTASIDNFLNILAVAGLCFVLVGLLAVMTAFITVMLPRGCCRSQSSDTGNTSHARGKTLDDCLKDDAILNEVTLKDIQQRAISYRINNTK